MKKKVFPPSEGAGIDGSSDNFTNLLVVVSLVLMAIFAAVGPQ